MSNRTVPSLATSAVAAALAGLVAWAGSDGGARAGGLPVIAWCAALAFGVNWVAFVPSWLAHTERFYDLTGSLTYLAVTALGLVLVGRWDPLSLLLAGLVGAWALRLGTFLFRRVRREGSDSRFDEIKHDGPRLFMTWTLQGLWVFLTLAAALGAITAARESSPGALAVVGAGVWLAGFAIEVVADRQKQDFRRDPANRGRFITTGVWAWSRHPNYFGEITLWVGVALVGVVGLAGWRYVTLVSPVFVFVLLTRMSGVPLLEARAAKRWGDDPAFVAYTENTPVLLLRPPRQPPTPGGGVG